MKYERINVVGTSGAGKSTFAQETARRLSLPYIELDRLFWKSNWTEPTDDEFFPKLRDALAPGRWVLDGNYDRTRHIKWHHVQMVVWLDLPLYLVFARVFASRESSSGLSQEVIPAKNSGQGIRRPSKKRF